MAKTIKELANEYAHHYEADDDAAYRGYVAGANAVLDIIKECLEEPSMIQGYSDIMAVVQELKGE